MLGLEQRRRPFRSDWPLSAGCPLWPQAASARAGGKSASRSLEN
jgi:hypothetical protein